MREGCVDQTKSARSGKAQVDPQEDIAVRQRLLHVEPVSAINGIIT
jgi:hypothetical protein